MCTQCSSGRADLDSDPGTECVVCPAAHVSLSGMTECLGCTAGKYLDAVAPFITTPRPTCDAGGRSPGAGYMQACEAEEGCVYEAGSCQLQTQGRLRIDGTRADGTLVMRTLPLCDAGGHLGGAGFAQACEADAGCQYIDGSCQRVVEGTIEVPVLACFACAPGRYSSGPVVECSSCGFGYYQNRSGGLTCDECPDLMFCQAG